MINSECVDPNAPTEKCVVCGNTIYTCERETSVNNSYLCPVIDHNNGHELSDGSWVCNKNCEDQYLSEKSRSWIEYYGDLFDVHIKLFHPFNFVGIKTPKFDTEWHPSDDVYHYGFSLDLTTELYYYTYDWGYGFNLRLLGFGFEINKLEK